MLCSEGYPAGLLGLSLGPGQLHIHPPGVETLATAVHTLALLHRHNKETKATNKGNY